MYLAKKTFKIGRIFGFAFILLILTSCRNKTKWFNYDCKWECTEYNFYLGIHGGQADFTYNETNYHFINGKSNDGTTIEFCYEDKIVMFANTTYKDDILYLEFTQDDIANLEGKTLTFTKVIDE